MSEEVDELSALGFGVRLFSLMDRLALWVACADDLAAADLEMDDLGVLHPPGLDAVCLTGVFLDALRPLPSEASDMGGDGGSWTSDKVSIVDRDLVSGGVLTRGELAADSGEAGAGAIVVVIWVRWPRAWCFLSLDCRISASILRSDNSSRNRWASTRSRSLSCSPILISSSIMTARSMATLYLDSRSSSEEDVFRAWRSKSSLATSISRSFS